MYGCGVNGSASDSGTVRVIVAVEKMTEEGIGRLLVMEDDTLVGIVSRSSIMDGAVKRMLS